MDIGMPFLLETETQEDCIALCNRLGLQFIEWNMNFPQLVLETKTIEALTKSVKYREEFLNKS